MSLKVALIIGSTRPSNVGQTIAEWYIDQAKDVSGMEIDVIDLKEVDLPLLDEPVSASFGGYTKEHSKKWSKIISQYDAYIWLTAEYNHSVPGALKNAIDFLFHEWAKKPVALVSYGSMGGVRAAEHLRQIAGELQMVDIRETVMVRNPWAMLDENGNLNTELVHGSVVDQLAQLKWWAEVLKAAREK